MKAILLVDNPNCCNDCQYCEYIQSDECAWCHLKFRIVKNDMKKSSWCPLKPLPEKLIVRGFDRYEEGGNECIDEILLGEDK